MQNQSKVSLLCSRFRNVDSNDERWCQGIPKWSSLISLIRDIKPSACPQWMCTDYNIYSFMCLVLCFSEDFPPNQFYFTVPLPLSISPSHHQYGKTDEMAITLAQSLGQNIGIFSDKKRILNGTPSSFTKVFWSGHVNMFFLCVVFLSRRVCVWWSLVRLYHGWCWVSSLLCSFKRFDI